MLKTQKISVFPNFFAWFFIPIFLLALFGFSRPLQAAAFCDQNSNLYLSLRDFSGRPAASLRFELYEQDTNNSLSVFGNRVGDGWTDAYGQGQISFKPNTAKSYGLKIWDKNIDYGEFRFYDALRFSCGSDKTISKQIPSLSILLRGADSELKKNFDFSLYVQRFDADNKPYFNEGDLVANLKTNSAGEAKIFVSPYNAYGGKGTGFYALSFRDKSDKRVIVYSVNPYASSDKIFEYRFTGLNGILKNAAGEVLADREVKLYEQSSYGKVGKELNRVRSDAGGWFNFEYSAGTYAISVLDDFKREDFFWNNGISSSMGEDKTFRLNLSRFSLVDAQGEDFPDNPDLEIYALKGEGSYTRGDKIAGLRLESNLKGSASLAAGKYLVVYYASNGKEYGQAFEAVKGRIQNIKVMVNEKYLVRGKTFSAADIQDFSLSGNGTSSTAKSNSSSSSTASSAAKGLRGRILLQVEAKGEAWYVNPIDGKRYFLGRPQDAFDLMRRFGLGISNTNFAALNANPNAYSALAGRILLKVEDSGKAYYFDPVNLKLYYLGRPSDAFNVIRGRGLGITNLDIDKINQGN